jgi:MFS family permease
MYIYIGGVLAQTFSWRADFVLLAVMTVPMALFAYIFNPETHHWYLVKSKSKMLEDMIRKREGEIESNDLESNFQSNSNAVVIALDECKELSHKDMDNGMTVINDLNDDSIFINSDVDSIKKNSIKEDNFQSLSNSVDKIDYSVKEEDISDILEPELMMPWTVAAYLLDPELAAYYSAVGFTFACMFTSLTILPQFLVKPPYLLDATITGVSFLPVGVAMLLGALIGGKLSDWSGKRFSNVADGQMIAVLLISWMCPLGTHSYICMCLYTHIYIFILFLHGHMYIFVYTYS